MGSWPPIVVWGEHPVVLDGCHRVEAARRLGRHTVRAIRFLGSPEEAFVEAIRRNVHHGLPLSITDRRRAAECVLVRNPEWSDRRIGSLCGLSDKSVGRLRRLASGGIAALDRRIGLDGRVRPVQPGQVRARVRDALADNPQGSLRAIAAIAGASPETVRSVRASLLAGATNAAEAEPLKTSLQMCIRDRCRPTNTKAFWSGSGRRGRSHTDRSGPLGVPPLPQCPCADRARPLPRGTMNQMNVEVRHRDRGDRDA